MAEQMVDKRAGKYELIKNDAGKVKSEGRLYYQIYIPADIARAEIAPDAGKDSLKRIYQEIGKMQGLGFYENDLVGKNRKLCQQEAVSLLRYNGVRMELTDRFSNQPLDAIKEKMALYDSLEETGDISSRKILQGGAKIGKRFFGYRKKQIWEDKEVKRVSLREHNPTSPGHVPELMRALSEFAVRKNNMDPIIKAGLLCYQFLTIMPFEEDNEIWVSILLNSFLREQGIETGYYIPFARDLLKQEDDRKDAMKQVRENADYGVWLQFFMGTVLRTLERMNNMFMELERIHKNTVSSILIEKQRELLENIVIYMEETPVFTVADIEKEFHIAYNTAAKMITILEKHDVVKEISEKQRYRIYCYEKYVQEIL